jgi:ring-1,2-phenylacetyl-CoA epoxidase subunit PaaC
MSDDWSPEAVDFVQSLADTKLMLSHWYADQAFLGPNMGDNIALFSMTQDEYGQVRQFYLQLDRQGRDENWLRSERDTGDFYNAATTDGPAADWTEFEVKFGLTDRAALLLLDAIDHEDFTGLTDKMAEEEYSHTDFHDGWLEQLAAANPAAFQAALEDSLDDVLAFLGPAAYDEDTDPLYASGFTDRSVAELRDAFLDYLAGIVEGTDVDVPEPTEVPLESWNEERRRVAAGSIEPDVLETIRGTKNTEFAAE